VKKRPAAKNQNQVSAAGVSVKNRMAARRNDGGAASATIVAGGGKGGTTAPFVRKKVPNQSETSALPARSYSVSRRANDGTRPSETMLSVDAPFVRKRVPNQDQLSNYAVSEKFNVTARMNEPNKPSNTVLTGGAVAGNNSPFVKRVPNQDQESSRGMTSHLSTRRFHTGSAGYTVTGAENDPEIVPRKEAPVHEGEYAALLERELPQDAPPGRGIRVASFFCCAGGIDLGFRSAGFELVFAIDIDKCAADTYERNLGHRPLVRDVREVTGKQVPQGVDVLTGGFPCVTFSVAGKRMGVTDDVNGKLYLELCRLIDEVRPRYFVAENVKGILSANNGSAVKLVHAAFLRLGYATEHLLVNMAEHGVPQVRERVIFFGVRSDQHRGSFPFPAKTRRLPGDKLATAWLPRAVTVEEAIGDLPEPEGEQPKSSADLAEEGWRRMTVRECARVQSFPDWFEFVGAMTLGYSQVGNAVPPLYAKRLASAILEYDRRPVLPGAAP
jgi:DNA (cytosine-5)-methyltransferase 1